MLRSQAFFTQMENSRVNITKEWEQWDWDVIEEIVEHTLTRKGRWVIWSVKRNALPSHSA